MNNKETEQLLKSLESLLEKEANGENIDQEILIKTSENGQWVLEKGIKSRLASALGAIKEKAKKMREKKPTSIMQDQHGKYDGGEAFRNRLDHLITDHMKRHTPPPVPKNAPPSPPKKSESVPPPPPKKSEKVPPPAPDFESRKLTPAQAKAAGLPKAPKEGSAAKAKKPAAKKPKVEVAAPKAGPAVKVKSPAAKKPKVEAAAPTKPAEPAKKAKTKKIKTEVKGE